MMTDKPRHALSGPVVGGVQVPQFVYGTAWKEDRTESLVLQALAAGFRAFDTANQRKHYVEAGVGDALRQACDEGLVRRNDLFLQTKFTYERGQDHRVPYDPAAEPEEQVRQSMASSLDHLHAGQVDSYVLHGPSTFDGLAETDHRVWKTMEELQLEGKTRFLGVSNVSLEQLQALCDRATVLPTFVQIRCYASQGWSRDIREFCGKHGILFQGFSLLTANRPELQDPRVQEMAVHHGKTVPQLVFRFARQLGMIPLTGTSHPDHMRQDLEIQDFSLSPEEVATIERLSG